MECILTRSVGLAFEFAGFAVLRLMDYDPVNVHLLNYFIKTLKSVPVFQTLSLAYTRN